MAKFVYTPPTGDDPEEITAFGQKWRAGKIAVLKDEGWLAHLMGHPHFKRQDAPKDGENEGGDRPPTDPDDNDK